MIAMYDYGYVIVASWLVLIVVWVLGAFTAKRDVAKQPKNHSVGSGSILLLGLLIFALWNLYLYDHAFLLIESSLISVPQSAGLAHF